MTAKIQIMNVQPKKIEVCCGGDCIAEGAEEVLRVLEKKYDSAVEPCGCVDQCEKAVNVIVDETQIFSYSTPENIVAKIEQENGGPYCKFISAQLDLSDDFLDDL